MVLVLALLCCDLHACSRGLPPSACRMSEEVVRVFLTLGELTNNRWGVPTPMKSR